MTGSGSKVKGRRQGLTSILLIAALLLGGLLGWAGIQAYANAHPGHLVVITDSEGMTYELPLDRDAQQVITTPLGTNTVVVDGGRVHIEEADCPGQDCVEHDSISNAGETIICLPNQLVVTISAGEGSMDGVLNTDDSNAPASDFDTIAR